MNQENTQYEGELARTLDLKAGLAIGIGTMIGAGIFVFPGIAAGNAGLGAAVSYHCCWPAFPLYSWFC